MLIRTLIGIASIILSGCGPTISGGNSRGGTMDHVIGLTKGAAFDKADAACKEFGRVARVSQYDVIGSTLNYDCVDP